MTVLRKILLFLLALAVSVGAYFLYKLLTNPPAIEVGGGYKIVKSEKPSVVLDDQEGSIGETVIGETEVSEFNLLDAQGNIKSRFGFEKLVHSEGTQWQLDKPYVHIFDKNYKCAVNSESGFITIEMVAGKPVPVSAKLTDDVVINFVTKEGGRDFDIYLESLVYDIERNRFESSGEVRLVSDQMEMTGTGMTLHYNPSENRIELLKIPSLDHIAIKERRLKKDTGEDGEGSLNDKIAASTPQSASDGLRYEFILDDNVTVLTENETINAQTVRISNILWEQRDTEPAPVKAAPEQPQQQRTQAKLPARSEDGFEYWQPEKDAAEQSKVSAEVAEQAAEYETVTTLYVTCDGGLVFRPLEKQPQESDAERTIDLIGSPVKVSSKKFNTESPYLWYGFDSKTLRLYSRQQGEIKLIAADGNASLVTENSLFWDDSRSLATVKGPGSIFAADKAEATRTKLDFLDTISLKMDAGKIEEVNVSGGFEADITGDNVAHISSSNAVLSFEGESELKKVELSDHVKVVSDQGGVEADRVVVDFAAGDNGKPVPQKAFASGHAKLLAVGDNDIKAPVMNASNIEYDFDSETAVAAGNIELTFSLASVEGRRQMPLTVNADRNVVYKAGDGYVEFNENVRGVSLSEHKGFSEQSTFSCDKLIVYLENAAESLSDSPTLDKLLLEGSKVVIENKRFTADKLISVVNLECSGFEYDAASGIMTARGPGSIKVNNRDVAGSSSDSDISLGGPCYALIENFTDLRFNTKSNTIIAESGDKLLHIGYLPITPDGSGTQRLLDTGRIEINYVKTPRGRTEISYIVADNKVYYYEPDKYQLIGDNLRYNASTDVVTIKGTENNPCVLNSTLVEGIEYNLRTGNIKTDISGVSSVPLN